MTRDEARHRSLLPRTKAGYALVVKHGPVLIADVIATEDEAVIRERGRLYSEVGRLSTFVVPTGVYVDVSDVLSLLDVPAAQEPERRCPYCDEPGAVIGLHPCVSPDPDLFQEPER
jgi:hypothetical protein